MPKTKTFFSSVLTKSRAPPLHEPPVHARHRPIIWASKALLKGHFCFGNKGGAGTQGFILRVWGIEPELARSHTHLLRILTACYHLTKCSRLTFHDSTRACCIFC